MTGPVPTNVATNVAPGNDATRQTLAPPRVTGAWYIACPSSALRPGQVMRWRLFGRPIAVFRTGGGAVGALEDRCPHRSVPLSEGEVLQDTLRCAYHGWQFAPSGRCKVIPGLTGVCDRAAHAAEAHAVREQQGFVWVWGAAGEAPTTDPFVFRCADDPRYLVVRREVEANSTIHGVAENALDVPHTAFLHRGLFRNDRDRKPIQCVVTRGQDRVECEYIGEPRPEGLIGRMLSPSGGVVVHFDRFYLPSVVEVEYTLGEENHVLVDAALTPLDDFHTRLHAVVALRTRFPGWLIKPLLMPFALRIFSQDAAILARQTAAMHAFGEQRFVSTEIDGLGPHILKLLLRAAAGVETPDRPWRKEFTLLV